MKLSKRILTMYIIAVLLCSPNYIFAENNTNQNEDELIQEQNISTIDEDISENTTQNEENNSTNNMVTLNETNQVEANEVENTNTENETTNEVSVDNEINEETETKEDSISTMMLENNERAVINTQTIQDGTYFIATALDESKVVDISGGDTSNYANAQIWRNDRVEQQAFKITYLQNGYYSIMSFRSGKYLTVNQDKNVVQYDANNSDEQQWSIRDEGNGYFSIVSKNGDLYLDVSNAHTANGTNIQAYYGNNTNAQKFKFFEAQEYNGTKTIEEGIYYISSALNNNMILDVSGAQINSGANIQLWKNVKVSQQKFIIKYMGNGYYTIENLNSEKVLDVQGGAKKNWTNIWQYDKNGSDAQKWVIKDAGNGYYNVISKCNGLYIDVANGDAKNGSNIQLYEGNNTKAQKFKFNKLDIGGTKTISNGIYTIESKLRGSKVLDIDAASRNSGANVQIWDNCSVDQQKFIITYLDNGFYQITNVNSGKALDVSGGAKRNGTNVWQYDGNNSKAQQWIIKDCGNGYYNIISRCNELFLDVNNASTRNGTNIQVFEGNNTNAQKFKLNKIEFDGIDVSQFQGNIDWTSVKNEGLDFVVHRIGFRGYGAEGNMKKDSKFDYNIEQTNRLGINSSVYFVTQATNYWEGQEEANFVLNNLNGHTINGFIVIDVEWAGGGEGKNGRADYISKEDRTQAIKGFCERIRSAGYNPMIYANKDWLNNKMNLSELSSYQVWLAHYVKGAPNNKSDYKGNYLYWQYTNTGVVKGINGFVDRNKGF